MLKQYREIRERYSDAACGGTDRQILRDLQALLRYIDLLHEGIARQAAEHLVSEAFEAFDTQRGRSAITH